MDITINNLTKEYRGNVRAIDGLNLSIPNGMFGLLGPNGAGKTTLMRILAGILHPSSGALQVGPYDGSTQGGRSAIQRMLGYLPQELGIYPDLNAYEFLDYVAILKGIGGRKLRRQRIEELLKTVSLTNEAGRRLKTFSGGMKRRVGIAQALLADPRFLIVDEPTAGLDPEERIRFRNLLSELAGERTVLLSTHIVEDISQTCQRLAIMKQGRVIFQGTVAGLLREARGRVWLLNATGEKPAENFSIVSMVNMGTYVQYRVVGELAPHAGFQPAEPGLEDAYVWLITSSQLSGQGSIHLIT
jgi:ABC-2 type transport system ATP-binding protein